MAIRYIKSFDLPPDEEYCLIECEVRKRSRLEVASALPSSVETVDHRRHSAFGKLAWGMRGIADVEGHIRKAIERIEKEGPPG
jgi:DNA-directed RNA polymerase specialized sigma24 family protein